MQGLPQLPQDKANHVLYGLAAYLLAAAIAGPIAGLVFAALAGAAKEAYDATGRGHVEALDFLATTAGGAAGMVCAYI